MCIYCRPLLCIRVGRQDIRSQLRFYTWTQTCCVYSKVDCISLVMVMNAASSLQEGPSPSSSQCDSSGCVLRGLPWLPAVHQRLSSAEVLGGRGRTWEHLCVWWGGGEEQQGRGDVFAAHPVLPSCFLLPFLSIHLTPLLSTVCHICPTALPGNMQQSGFPL